MVLRDKVLRRATSRHMKNKNSRLPLNTHLLDVNRICMHYTSYYARVLEHRANKGNRLNKGSKTDANIMVHPVLSRDLLKGNRSSGWIYIRLYPKDHSHCIDVFLQIPRKLIANHLRGEDVANSSTENRVRVT